MKPAGSLIAILLSLLMIQVSFGQESDYDVKVNFEAACQKLKNSIDSSKSTPVLDSLKSSIDSVESQFAPREEFLNKALYPETFAGKIASLKNLMQLTYDRVYLIQNQGTRIEELEGRIILITARIDSLSLERDRLFAELKESKASLSRMREAIRKLTATIQAKDRLIFALIDSIFLPYDKNINQITDVQKEAIAARLLKANVAARVFDIAEDNVKFLETTQLQPKDFANLIDQHEQFSAKWNGLREKINAVSYSSATTETREAKAGKTGPSGRGAQKAGTPSLPDSQTHVDSVLMDWDSRLAANFWSALYKDLTGKGVKLQPFTDGKSFSGSIRAYVDSAKARGEDTTPFINDVWRARIDREWRDALSHESMLGATEYAALDKYVSTLAEEKFDLRFVMYMAIVVILVALVLWRFRKKPKAQAPESQEPGSNETV